MSHLQRTPSDHARELDDSGSYLDERFPDLPLNESTTLPVRGSLYTRPNIERSVQIWVTEGNAHAELMARENLDTFNYEAPWR